MSTLGDIMSTLGDIMSTHGDIMINGGKFIKKTTEFVWKPGVLNIPQCTYESPHSSWYPPMN